MQYTAEELRVGTPIKNPLIAGNTYTFLLYRPINQTGWNTYLSGSAYFTVETVGDVNKHYQSDLTKFAEGVFDNPDGTDPLPVSSSFIFSYGLNTGGSEPMTSSFTFVPDNTIGIGQVLFRATGNYDMDVSPLEEGCGVPTPFPGGQAYPTTLNFELGPDTGTVGCLLDPFGFPDRFIINWDGNIVIDTGYLTDNSGVTRYNIGGDRRQVFINSLLGKTAPEGGTYPLPPGGSGNNIILSDGYPQCFEKTWPTPVNFTKDNSISGATVDVYGPMPGTSWNVTVNCPVPDSYPQASYSSGGDAVNDCGGEMFFTVYLELATPNIVAIGDVVHSSANIGSGVIDGNDLFHRIQTGDGTDWNAKFGADGIITQVNACP